MYNLRLKYNHGAPTVVFPPFLIFRISFAAVHYVIYRVTSSCQIISELVTLLQDILKRNSFNLRFWSALPQQSYSKDKELYPYWCCY
jgi:hypothetical protein